MLAENIETRFPGNAEDFQAALLAGVSRTFALTIPLLPAPLSPVVENGYLLCRIIDTIEDEPGLAREEKVRFCRNFSRVLAGDFPVSVFVAELAPRLSGATLPAERALVRHAAQVIDILSGFDRSERDALTRCVTVMSAGMAEFQGRADKMGLRNLDELNRYCYFVAGVVGEMLTRLFCDYSPQIARNREALTRLSISFGQGLQMTNILKDVWDDLEQGRCWLPRDVFAAAGLDLERLAPDRNRAAFEAGLQRLVAIASRHLADALRYILLIPKGEAAIRKFCLDALGMAVLTLRKINANPGYASASEVKISRRSVRAAMFVGRHAALHDTLLRVLFRASQLERHSLVPGLRS